MDVFNIDGLYDYFNDRTAKIIKNKVLTECNKVYG